MKAKAMVTTTSSWPVGVPFFDPEQEPRSESTARPSHEASVGPIELRIDGHGGPSAIAILE